MKRNFLAKNGLADCTLKTIKSDASFRKFFRVQHKEKNKKFILVSSPPSKENNTEYIKTSKLFFKIGLSVPKVTDYDKKKGLFLIEDFGNNTYSKYLKDGFSEHKLYNLAVENLIYLQKNSYSFLKKKTKYTNKKFIDEIKLFLLWYWPAIFKEKPKETIIYSFLKIWKDLLMIVMQSKQVIVHRDFHIDNLFFLKDRRGIQQCGIIDFQDAVVGPQAYDLVSLLEDARRNVNKRICNQMYTKFVNTLNKKDRQKFKKEYQILATNRHIKVIGIFTRLFIRDRKKEYLKHIPRLWNLLEKNLKSKHLLNLKLWFDEYLPKKYRIKPKF